MTNCKTCKHWKKVLIWGVCEHLDSMDNDTTSPGCNKVFYITEPEFGCVLHEGEPC